MYCNQCGSPVTDGSRFCSECGVAVGEAPHAGTTAMSNVSPVTNRISDTSIGTRDQANGPKLVYPRNPPLSPHLCWVNIFIAGLAQIIHKQVAKGFAILFLTIVSNLVFPLLLAVGIGILSILDAFMVGRKLKKGKPVGKWQFFPF